MSSMYFSLLVPFGRGHDPSFEHPRNLFTQRSFVSKKGIPINPPPLKFRRDGDGRGGHPISLDMTTIVMQAHVYSCIQFTVTSKQSRICSQYMRINNLILQ